MRWDLLRYGGDFVRCPLVGDPRPVRLYEDEPGVRVHDRGAAKVFERRLPTPLVLGLEDELDARAALAVPEEQVVRDDLREVLLGVDKELEDVGGLLLLDLGDHAGGTGAREPGVEDGRRDPDPLLATGLAVRVKSRPVEEPSEDVRDLTPKDPGAVVRDRDRQSVGAGFRDLDQDLGEDPGLLAGVERIVDPLLDGREECSQRVVEAEDLAIPLEELGDRDLALLRCELLGEGAGPGHGVPTGGPPV